MFPLVRSARPRRRVILPGSAYVWAVCCNHLRFMWQFLTFLTALCVVLQLLSIGRQFLNINLSRLDSQFLRDLTSGRQDGKVLQTASSWLDDHLFQREDGKKEAIHLVQTPARHLARTAMILTPSPKTTKAYKLFDTKKHSMVNLKAFVNSNDLSTTFTVQKEFSAHTTFDQGVFGDKAISAKTRYKANRACQPKNHVFFLKTHKTASSTVLNILNRYGDSRNLSFALPTVMNSQFFYPNFFMSYFVEGISSHRFTKFNIMCNHLRFHSPEVKKVLPPETFYFSILRNPVFMMESLFSYYKSIQAFMNFKSLEEFLLDNGRSYNGSVKHNHYALNILTFDFGLDNSAPLGEEDLDRRAVQLISSVESQFHLVLISEYFDESMIILKHSLCWTLEDVVSFRLNSRSDKSRKPLTPEMAERVKKWNSLDWRLYQHFNVTFWQRIDTLLGRTKLQEEVKALRSRRAELEKTCLLEGGAVDPAKVRDSVLKPFQYGQAVIQGHNIRPGLDDDMRLLCERLITPELQYTTTLYTKQFPDLAKKHNQIKSNNSRKKTTVTKTRPDATKKSSQTVPKPVLHNTLANTKQNVKTHVK